MPSVHKHNPIPFRPPEGDRSWLLAYAEAQGRPVNAVLVAALGEYRARHGGTTTVVSPHPPSGSTTAGSGITTTPSGTTTSQGGNTTTPPAARPPARDTCPHPRARVIKGFCGACGTNVS